MLKSAFSSPKIRTLAAILKIPFSQAVGMCGMLWNFTADHAPRGNVGKHTDLEIAMAVEWPGDPVELVRALLVVRLLDAHPTYRLLVHDWAEHCPRYVHATLKRKNQAVICVTNEPTTVATTVPTVVPTVVATTSSSASTSSSAATSTSSSTSSDIAPTAARRPSKPKDSIAWMPATGWTGITEADRAAWGVAYPACDLTRQLAAADQWLRANPAKAHKSLWRKFIAGWLSRAQERGGDAKSNGQHKPIDRQAAKRAAVQAAWGLTPEEPE
jgi:hypothetical protein